MGRGILHNFFVSGSSASWTSRELPDRRKLASNVSRDGKEAQRGGARYRRGQLAGDDEGRPMGVQERGPDFSKLAGASPSRSCTVLR